MAPELREAALSGDVDRLCLLLAAGSDVNCKDRYGQTMLMLSASHGHVDAVRLLIGRGADLDVRAKYNLTALMLAIIRGHPAVALLLIQAGSDTSIKGSREAAAFGGKNALALARERGQTEIADLLLGGEESPLGR